MAISKKIREEVYRKYDGHCAYCGREIAYKDMQVDHFLPLRAWGIEDAGTDDISNLMPSCRMCNHYKRAHTLETFRRYIAEIPRKLRENYIYKVGVVYGNVIENEKPIEFYFEKQKSATHLGKGCENGWTVPTVPWQWRLLPRRPPPMLRRWCMGGGSEMRTVIGIVQTATKLLLSAKVAENELIASRTAPTAGQRWTESVDHETD